MRARQPSSAVDRVALAEPAADARFVTALARGLEVLRAFTPHDRWLAHREIVRRTGLPAATVSRLAYTLACLGHLRHRAATGEYALGAAVLTLGFSVLGNFDIGRIARPYMQALADECEAAVSLGVRHETTMVYVAHCRSPARLILGLDVGTRLPIATTAMGRAVLFALPTPERERLLARLAALDPPAWLAVAERLARAGQTFAERGFVTSESEWEAEIAAVGVPLQLADNRAPMALTIGGPAARLRGDWLHGTLGPRLLQAALRIRDAVSGAEGLD